MLYLATKLRILLPLRNSPISAQLRRVEGESNFFAKYLYLCTRWECEMALKRRSKNL